MRKASHFLRINTSAAHVSTGVVLSFLLLFAFGVASAQNDAGLPLGNGPSLGTGPLVEPPEISGSVRRLSPAKPADFSVIQHFVFIIKENRSFDHYFGTFPGANGATSGAISTGQVLGHTPDATSRDIGHDWKSYIVAIDRGRMDQWDLVKFANKNGDYLAMTQLYESDIPNYWAYARNFVLGDNAFSSIHSMTFEQHLYAVGGQSAGAYTSLDGALQQNGWGCDSNPGTTVPVFDSFGNTLNVFPCFDFMTLPDLLEAAGISWAFYAPPQGKNGYIFSTLNAINHIRNTSLWTTNVLSDKQFSTDALTGNLPAVSWLTTGDGQTDHPPLSACYGENWAVDQINAIMEGPDWNTTAIFMVWDDPDGFYDHVVPPILDQFGLGPRVPLLIISPYAKSGYVTHTQFEHSSFLKIVEERYGLSSLTARDGNADDMMDAFDFTQEPVQPLILSKRNCVPTGISEMNFNIPQRVNQPSPVQVLLFANYQPATMTISNIAIAGDDFSYTTDCGSELHAPRPGKGYSTCTISVSFSPTTAGPRSGTLTVTDSDPTSPQVVSLSGIGTNVSLTPSLLSFGTFQVGTLS